MNALFCISAVSVFKAAPNIVNVSSDSVIVSVEQAFGSMDVDDTKHFQRGELHLLQPVRLYSSMPN